MPAWPGPRRIAHRGGGTLAPENTMAAIREGIARGFRGVEFDVMLTADDVPVLMHDATFGRTIPGSGSVARTSYAELARRDAGGWFGGRHAGEPVPRYADVVRACCDAGVWMNVEIKPSSGAEAVTGRVVGELTVQLYADAGDDVARPLFSSFSREALEAARKSAPAFARGLLFDAMPDNGIDEARALDCVSVHVDQRYLDARLIARLHAAGFRVATYTVNDVRRLKTLEEAGVDAVITDRIDLIGPL